MAITDNNALGIPISDIRDIIAETMGVLGEDVIVNGTSTKATVIDAKEAITIFRQNLKQITVLYDIPIKRGDVILFNGGEKGVVYNIPVEDIVSFNAEVLMYNSFIDVYRNEKIYDEDLDSPNYGQLITSGEHKISTQDGYMERIASNEIRTDMGYRIISSFKFVTDESFAPTYNDIIYFKNKKFRVNDIDTVTRGLVTIEMVEIV